MKGVLVAALLALPPLAAWEIRDKGWLSQPDSKPAAADPVVRVPVEVLSKGSAPEWVVVEVVAPQSVPEPAGITLTALAVLLWASRRRRECNE